MQTALCSPSEVVSPRASRKETAFPTSHACAHACDVGNVVSLAALVHFAGNALELS
jgi:phosphotransferase system IIA component